MEDDWLLYSAIISSMLLPPWFVVVVGCCCCPSSDIKSPISLFAISDEPVAAGSSQSKSNRLSISLFLRASWILGGGAVASSSSLACLQ